MKKKQWVFILVFVLLGLIVGGWFLLKGEAKQKTEWRTAKIEKGDIQVTVRASGTLQAVTTVQVGTQVSGIIKNIFVDFNSEVRAGQVIALLDTTLLAQQVEDAQAALRRSQIQVNQTKREYERTKTLFEQKVMAQADYDLALTNYETAETNLVSATSALNRAKINLRYATIVAPISGVVVSRAVDVGQTVAASFSTPTMFTIANDLTKMQVQANIDEGDIGKIKMDQEVTFSVDAYPDATFTGTVRQIRLLPVTTQNVVNYTVIIDVPNPDMKLLPGMTANITVMVDEVKDILKVPSTALRFSPPQEYIDTYEKSLPDSVKKMREMWKSRMASGGGPGSMGGGMSGGMSGGPGGPGGERGFSGGGRPGEGMSGARMGGGMRKGGTIWIKSGDSIRPHRVRTGVTDGLNTEVRGRDIKEGDEVVLGAITQDPKTSSQQTQNPFAPQMQRPGGPTRGGR